MTISRRSMPVSYTHLPDFLNETGVSGWCYQNSQPSSPADFTLRIANVLTGETVQEIPATTSLSRPDLESRTGAESTPGFFVSIDWESLGSGLYTASIVSTGKTVGNSLSYHVSGADGQSGLLEGISSVQNLGNFRITGYCSCRSLSLIHILKIYTSLKSPSTTLSSAPWEPPISGAGPAWPAAPAA